MPGCRTVCCVYPLVLALTLAGCRTAQPRFTFQPPLTVPAGPSPGPAPARLHSLPLSPGRPALRLAPPQARRMEAAAVRPRAAGASALSAYKGGPQRLIQRAAHLASRPPRHVTRDYSPLVLAVLLAALGILLLSASAVGLAGSYIPVVGVLVLLLAGAVYFHWRYEG